MKYLIIINVMTKCINKKKSIIMLFLFLNNTKRYFSFNNID